MQNPYLTRKERAHAAHNLGNAYMQTEAYAEAVDAYKQALRQRPEDADSKYNLAYAQKLLQQQQQQQQNGDNQDKQNQNQDQQPQNQDQQDKDQDQQSRQNQQDNQQPDDASQQPQEHPDTQQGRESQEDRRKKSDAEKILQALENQEKKTLDKVKKKEMPVRKKNPEKDW
ncbi:MAG: tetratricopeptide repeat protein [Bacteroidales bacterium]|nr:tetratricopeptide repeat protein [Bacteroidales bacterium]